VVNPGERTTRQLGELLERAHNLAAQRHSHRRTAGR
jgi:hypothetical protein